MKNINILLLLVLTTTASLAQTGSYSKKDKLLNLGIGVNSSYDGGIPIGLSYEQGITDNISAGVNADYLSNEYLSLKFTAIYFGLRASYHVNELLKIKNDKIDLYGGPTLGYRSFSWKDNGEDLGDSYGSGLFLGAYIGGKYYIANNIAVFTELGSIGSTNARIGVALKF